MAERCNDSGEGVGKLKRYLVLTHSDCYPSGGIGDLSLMCDTEEEATGWAWGCESWDILDTELALHAYGSLGDPDGVISWSPLSGR